MVLATLFYLLFPAVVVFLCNRVSILGKIGPILILYLVGIIVGNSSILPEGIYPLQDGLTSAVIPLAIPLMLFSTQLNRAMIRTTLLATFSGIVAVVVVVCGSLFIFRDQLIANPMVGENYAKLAGLLCGVYTGGTPNLAALKMMLDVPNETYILVHSYDMIISFSYLVILLAGGIKLFRWLLPSSKLTHQEVTNTVNEDNYSEIFTRQGWMPTLKGVALSVGIVALSVALSFIMTGGISMAIVILSLTTFGLACSRIRAIREIKTTFSAGMYLILIFSLTVSSMANFSEIDFMGGLYVLLYLGAVVFGSLLVQTLLSKLLKIDADSMIISSVSLINSPPFVPMMCSVMKNRNVMVVGLSAGVIGYAVGNYLGYIIFKLLETVI